MFVVKLRTGGASFTGEQENPFGDSTNHEVARILHDLADRVESMGERVISRDETDPFVLLDSNGNSAGAAHFDEEPT